MNSHFKEANSIIYVMPSQGNEPYKLGVDIALEVAEFIEKIDRPKPMVVVPSLYGQRQRQILKEEFPEDINNIYLDDVSGKILTPLLFGKTGYKTHLNDLVTKYPQSAGALNQRFSKGAEFEVRSLANNEPVSLIADDILASIDIGAKTLLPVKNRYYCFPVLYSELLKETVKVQESGEFDFGFSLHDMNLVRTRMERLEAMYTRKFIPQLSTLSCSGDYPYQGYITEYKDKTLTPPLFRNKKPTSGLIDKKGVYVMYSGTEVDGESNNQLFEMVWESGLEVFVPPWVDLESDVMHEGYDYFKASPSVIGDTNILAVAGRSGWGTGWQAQHFGKAWFVHDYQVNEDPEIYFNNKTIDLYRIGEIIGQENSYRDIYYRIMNYSVFTKAHIAEFQRNVFPTQDGIEYVAVKITNDLVDKGFFGNFD